MSKLSSLLEQHGLTVVKLHHDLIKSGVSISQQTIYNCISDGKMSLETAQIFAKYFKVPLEAVVF